MFIQPLSLNNDFLGLRVWRWHIHTIVHDRPQPMYPQSQREKGEIFINFEKVIDCYRFITMGALSNYLTI